MVRSFAYTSFCSRRLSLLPSCGWPKGLTPELKANFRLMKCWCSQAFPNAINEKAFPSVVLSPGEKYKHEVCYHFSTE